MLGSIALSHLLELDSDFASTPAHEFHIYSPCSISGSLHIYSPCFLSCTSHPLCKPLHIYSVVSSFSHILRVLFTSTLIHSALAGFTSTLLFTFTLLFHIYSTFHIHSRHPFTSTLIPRVFAVRVFVDQLRQFTPSHRQIRPLNPPSTASPISSIAQTGSSSI